MTRIVGFASFLRFGASPAETAAFRQIRCVQRGSYDGLQALNILIQTWDGGKQALGVGMRCVIKDILQ